MKRFNPIVVSVALLVSAAGDANAGPYAVSYDNVFDLLITPSPGVIIVPSVPPLESGAFATLPPVLPVISIVPPDPAPANLGTAVGTADNTFTPLGQAGHYARGDAAMDDPDLLGPPGGQARNIGESFLTSTGTGSGAGVNIFRFDVFVPPLGTLMFDFKADPYIEVAVPPGSAAGTTASGALKVNIHFLAFDWNPDGSPGGILGGTELADPFSLNTSILLAGAGSEIYDPTGDASFGLVPPAFGAFSALFTNTSPIFAVSGPLSIEMREDVATANVISEPSALTLFSMGALLGLGAYARRRRQQGDPKTAGARHRMAAATTTTPLRT